MRAKARIPAQRFGENRVGLERTLRPIDPRHVAAHRLHPRSRPEAPSPPPRPSRRDSRHRVRTPSGNGRQQRLHAARLRPRGRRRDARHARLAAAASAVDRAQPRPPQASRRPLVRYEVSRRSPRTSASATARPRRNGARPSRRPRRPPRRIGVSPEATLDSLPVHGCDALLQDLATLTLDDLTLPGQTGAPFRPCAEPTALQGKVFDLLGLGPDACGQPPS